MPVCVTALTPLEQLYLGISASGTKLEQNFKTFYMPKSKPFCVIGAVQYEMEGVREKAVHIAQWFYRHQSHAETRPMVEKEMTELAEKDGYYEVDDRIYVLQRT